jgi:phospholipid/cholesterol/gamma-HCH transport system ATP-binding protein
MPEPESNPELAEELTEAFGTRPEPAAPQPADEPSIPMICFKHVSLWFGERRILNDVSFEVNRGETLCIMGRSGVGKSVALRILMGFLRPQVGSVWVDGEEINGFSEEQMQAIRKRVTMVFQNGALFDSLSVRENIAFPLRERESLSEEKIVQLVGWLISIVGAEDVADAFPSSLSTGRKRAVAIARALALQPDVVLYDEPTTMVDPIIARRLGDLIQRLKQQLGYTSIVVTHDTRFAERLADTVLFLDQGRGIFFSSLKEFLASPDPGIQEFLALDAYLLPSE